MEFIKSKKELSTTKERQDVLDVLEAGLTAVHPHTLLPRYLEYNADFNSVIVQGHSYDLLTGRIFVAGAGKAAGAMAEVLEAIIGSRHITDGLVSTWPGSYSTQKIKIYETGKLLANRQVKKAAKETLAMKDRHKIGAKDLVIFLASAGAGGFMPIDPSAAGLWAGLSAHFAPARVLELVLSDQGEEDAAVFGADAGRFLLADTGSALEAMSHRAKELGLRAIIGGADLGGETADIAGKIARSLGEGEFDGYDIILFGGLTTPAAAGIEEAGRNRRFCQASIAGLSKSAKNWLVAAVSSDGLDPDKKSAGAIADSDGIPVIKTGITGTAVGDLVIYSLK
jgi:glycerate-2-kinase